MDIPPNGRAPNVLPARAGIGLRSPHIRQLLEERPAVGWLEAHSENYFGDGGQALELLEHLRARHPLSLHGVGLSLGSAGALDRAHLARLERLVRRLQPALVSEHLSWSAVDGRHLNDLLPLPGTEEALDAVCANIERTQDVLGRRILVENISSYLAYRHSTIPEPEFIAAVVARTGCGLLLDVNNVFVSAHNLGFDAQAWLAAMPLAAVQEIHLAGHASVDGLLVDTHGTRVAAPVWALYRGVVERLGPVPTLIEWDTDIPPLPVLLAEAQRADCLMESCHALAQ